MIEVNLTGLNLDNNEVIIENTKNTWQPNRTKEGKKNDSNLGKMAEKAVENYLNKNNDNYYYLSYDSFRNDDFKKHAPFDGLYISKDTTKEKINGFISLINNEVKKGNIKQNYIFKSEMIKEKIFTVEVKSTRITGRHKRKENPSEELIKKDDFLIYPEHKRKSSIIQCTKDYIDYCTLTKKIENYSLIPDINIRVYIDEPLKKAFIIGYITKTTFVKNMEIKKMPQKGKSEDAIYWAVNLNQAKPIHNLLLNKKTIKKQYHHNKRK